MKLHLINHTRKGMIVHLAGCADIAKTLRRGYDVNSDWVIEVPDGSDPATAAAADLNESFGWPYEGSDEPAPWSPSDIYALPCTRKAA